MSDSDVLECFIKDGTRLVVPSDLSEQAQIVLGTVIELFKAKKRVRPIGMRVVVNECEAANINLDDIIQGFQELVGLGMFRQHSGQIQPLLKLYDNVIICEN